MKIENQITCDIKKLPFKTSLSFESLIDDIRQIANAEKHPMKQMALHVWQQLNEQPEFKTTINDCAILNHHQDLMNSMMAFVFNPLNDTTELAGAAKPFSAKRFYTTRLFDQELAGVTKKMELAKDSDQDIGFISMIYQAYLVVLERVYHYKIDVDLPFTYRLSDEEDGSVRYYRKKVSTKYLNVKSVKPHPELSHDDIAELFNNAQNLNLWNEKLPLANFEFSGFLYFSYENITQDYVISQLKSDLLDKRTVVSQAGFEKIKKRMRALFQNPRLEFGMAVSPDLDATLNRNLVWNTIIPRSDLKCDQYLGTIYEKALHEGRIILTRDMSKLESNPVIDAFVRKGIRSHAVVPLILEGKNVGMLEFACVNADNISMLQVKRLHDVFPTFALALQRSKDEWDDKIRAVIQEEFTAIHPTVEWRFREAVAKLLSEKNEGEKSNVEPIVFPDIVPIYGASDIRGSSIARNKGIQLDLTEQLEHAKRILEQGKELKDMPLLHDISYKIGQHIKTVKSGLKAGDEVVILEFLKRDVDPLLLLLKLRYSNMEEMVQAYFNTLDPNLNVLYKKRKDFEDSLTMINDKVGEIIDEEQIKAQDVFPHYFEKYRTDGVEYNGYIGQSLVKDLEYNEIYLKNIRLWQLLVKVKVARKIRELQAEMATKLDITQLILVHSNPLSIAFRQDEKKFDVAGAYNIRYEITKKRIDKAMINGTNERVTQVGKIAIVYSHADEIREYKKYIDYMVAQGYLKPQVENLELEDLTGASGLRALRVEVDFSDLTPNVIDTAEIEEVTTSN